jgi:parvulin-like peptidyl-prolyl isomerase
VAKKYSDGPTASNGGQWEWTQKGSLADAAVDQALFETQVGASSKIIDGENAYTLVKVGAREEARRVPLADVQDEIKQKLQKESRLQATKEAIDKIKDGAVIETIFDNETNLPGASEPASLRQNVPE